MDHDARAIPSCETHARPRDARASLLRQPQRARSQFTFSSSSVLHQWESKIASLALAPAVPGPACGSRARANGPRTGPSGPACAWPAEVVVLRLSPIQTFHHLVSRALRARAHKAHRRLAPIGAVLLMGICAHAAALAASLCRLSSISGIMPKQRCHVQLYRNRPDT